MKQALINTGQPRSVLGHIVSGAVASAIISGTINYKKVKKEKMTSKKALKQTAKRASQGAIATGSAIATANYLGQRGGFFKALSAVSVGIAGIYAIELIDEKLNKKDEGKNYEEQL